jgi:hypothetical protein
MKTTIPFATHRGSQDVLAGVPAWGFEFVLSNQGKEGSNANTSH